MLWDNSLKFFGGGPGEAFFIKKVPLDKSKCETPVKKLEFLEAAC